MNEQQSSKDGSMSELTAEQSFSDAAVHHMCGHLRGDYKCERCPRRTQTPYGEGMHGCYALAEETLVVAKEAMKL